MALTTPLGKPFRVTRTPGGMISRQARTSQTFRPGSLIGARIGSEHAEVVSATSPRSDLVILGVFEGKALFSSTSTDDGTGGALDSFGNPQMVQIRPGPLGYFTTGTGADQILSKHVDYPCFAKDDDTVYLTSDGGTLSFAGFVNNVDEATGFVEIRVGEDTRNLFELYSAIGALPGTGLSKMVARCVITTIPAYTGSGSGVLTASAPGAIGAQDTSETLVVGDLVFLPKVTGGAGGATAAADEGPWEVTNPGGSGVKWVLTRPSGWRHGDNINPGATVDVQFGALWAGNAWKCFQTAAGKVIDTDAGLFWPRTQNYTYTIGGALSPSAFYLRTSQGFTSNDTTAAHAFAATTVTPGQGSGALAFTGTASDVIAGQAINF
jgi:hypothetical protein